NVPLIRFADKVCSIGSTGLDMLEFDPAPGLVERLRSFASAVSWYGSSRPEFRAAVERLGLTFEFLPASPSNGAIHAVDYYLSQVEPKPLADARGSVSEPNAFRGVAPRISVTGQVGNLPHAIIHPFASSSQKRWPLEKFREVS